MLLDKQYVLAESYLKLMEINEVVHPRKNRRRWMLIGSKKKINGNIFRQLKPGNLKG